MSFYSCTGHSSKPQNECGNCDVGGGKEREMYLLFGKKVLTKFAFEDGCLLGCCAV
jgi:hypothetical protein